MDGGGFVLLKAFVCPLKSQKFANPTGNDLQVVAPESLQKVAPTALFPCEYLLTCLCAKSH